MTDRRRSNLPALFIAPIASAVVGGAVYTLAILALSMPLDLVLYVSPLVAIAHLPLTLAATWSIGLPWHLWRQSVGKVSLSQYCSAAAIVGFFVGAAALAIAASGGTHVVSLTPADYPADFPLPAAPSSTGALLVGGALAGLYGAFIGALTGYFFWLVRRPDRDQSAAFDDHGA